MHFSSLKHTVSTTTLSLSVLLGGAVCCGQDFSPNALQVNPPATGSAAKPLYSFPRAKLNPELPARGGTSKPMQTRKKSGVDGSSYALPRASGSKSKPKATSTGGFMGRAGAGPKRSTAASQRSNEFSGGLPVPSRIDSTSSVNGGELFIGGCFVNLMQDIMIPAEEEGVLGELNVKEGDAVPTGKMIGKIDDGRLQQEARSARIRLAGAKDKASSKSSYQKAVLQYRLAKKEYETNARLAQKGSKSAHEVGRSKFSMDVARTDVDIALDERKEAMMAAKLEEVRLNQIEMIIGKMQISTPFDGYVLKIEKHPMEYVQKGESILRFARMDKVWVEGTVPSEACKPADVKGRRVRVILQQAGDQEVELQGRVVTGPMEIEGVGKRFRVRAEVENQFENGQWILLPGQQTSMIIELGPETANNKVGVNR